MYEYISENAKIDKNVNIDENVTIMDGATIKSGCIIGELGAKFNDNNILDNPKTIIGANSHIRSQVIIYADNDFHDNLQTGHRVTIREKTCIGKNVRIGTLSDIQGHCTIGNYVNLHSNVHIG